MLFKGDIMSEELKEFDCVQDAEIKFQKLSEIVEDVEQNGQNGDIQKQQIVIKAITASDNEFLFSKITDVLFDDSYSELFRTFAIGLLTQKSKWQAISEYTSKMMAVSPVINEIHKDRESLLLASDALIQAMMDESLENSADILGSLKTLYRAACNSQSTELIADALLQRMMNTLPKKSAMIDEMLISLAKDKTEDLNARLIAADVMTRYNTLDFWPVLEDMILDISSYAVSSEEKLFMYDVLTKSLNNIVIAAIGVDVTNAADALENTDFNSMVASVTAIEIEQAVVIVNRINGRMQNIREVLSSNN